MTAESSLDDGGRYLYCAVHTDEGVSTPAVSGIDGGEVRLIDVGDIGALVQPVDQLFDSTDPAEVRRWVLAHQRVVDAAREAYGTPLPFRFDTVLRGDDDVVREWLEERRGGLADALGSLEGLSEYRIHLRWDEQAVRDRLTTTDGTLSELEADLAAADEGRQYLVEKQYERAVDEKLSDRRAQVTQTVHDQLVDHVEAITVDSGDQRHHITEESSGDDLELVTAVSVLAPPAKEGPIGDRLEELIDGSELDVRFTGPWPPYTFAGQFLEDK